MTSSIKEAFDTAQRELHEARVNQHKADVLLLLWALAADQGVSTKVGGLIHLHPETIKQLKANLTERDGVTKNNNVPIGFAGFLKGRGQSLVLTKIKMESST